MLFTEFNLHDSILKALDKASFTETTKIQSEVIPLASEGKDIFGLSNTGTGKTAAFIIPLLDSVLKSTATGKKIKGLVLCPTRELVQQTSAFTKLIADETDIKVAEIYGGVNIEEQITILEDGCDIVIATPGRLCDLIRRDKISLNDVITYVLDEGDRMLDMGFSEDIRFITSCLDTNVQIMIFSATCTSDIESLISTYLKEPVRVDTSVQIRLSDTIKQLAYYIEKPFKNMLLAELLKKSDMKSAIIFTKTRKSADELHTFLSESGFTTDRLHSDRSQNARESIISMFRDGSLRLLIATDIAARGIDIDDISHVFNFELPQEHETFIHRIGRTARMGRTGTAITFCEPKDKAALREIQKIMKCHIPVVENHTYATLSLKKALQEADDALSGKSKKGYKGNKSNGDFFRRQKLAKKKGK